jgi:LysM repeat protein
LALCAVLFLSAGVRAEPSIHQVRRGDTLGRIAQNYGVRVAQIREWNQLRDSRIYVNQKLRVGSEEPAAAPTSSSTYTVQRGDTLYSIATRHELSVAELRALNGLQGNLISPGQKLTVRQARDIRYKVRRGDTLGGIAQKHGIQLASLRSRNGLTGSTIYPGQVLNIPASVGMTLLTLEDIDWSLLTSNSAVAKRIESPNGPYFTRAPHAVHQESQGYFENTPLSPFAAFQRAEKLFHEFERRVDSMGRLSHTLDGWHVVLDPGHGGIDPGAIVKTLDGNGDALYVVEDEYVYDVALRAYALLRLHGAKVTLTLLSPNHLIRDNVPAAKTFVHQRNEVFHDRAINESNRTSSWPRGGRSGLRRRREVIQSAIKGVSAEKTVFLSLHADNTPTRGREPMVLYYQRGGESDARSRQFANEFRKALGPDARTKGQSLAVLRDNPADVAVLVEMRNIAYSENSWALRFSKERQNDALRLVDGILSFAGRKQQLARAR